MGQSAGFGKSRADRAPRRGIHPALFYATFTLLLGTTALAATAFLMAPDIARLMNGQNELIVGAYEDRLAQMRVEIDRLHSRSYARAGDMNLQLQELSQQQETLLEQHQMVRVLVDKASQLGIASLDFEITPPDLLAPASTASGNPDIAATAAAVRTMMDETHMAMTGIAEVATVRTDDIVNELGALGIRLQLPDTNLSGTGGPLLDAADNADNSPLIEDANSVMAALLRYKAARESINDTPVSMPISGNFRQSSGYGNRKDPFSGSRAFHSGLDFAAASGTTVYSAGEGEVSFVGNRAGYGKVVEVTHSNGLVSRYAHLSAQLANPGQLVQVGTPIAQVGSTGRSTGPHLHFEVRRNDQPLDPKPFLETGKRLRALLS